MVKNYTRFLIVFLLIFSTSLYAQQEAFWTKTDAATTSSELRKTAHLKKYEAYDLKLEALSTALNTAPDRAIFKGNSSFKINFPDKNGKLESYFIKEAAVMHPDLAKQFPNNRSFIGVSVKDPSKRIRFSLNEIGLYAIIMDNNGATQYIEPLSKNYRKYRVYDRSELDNASSFQCLTENIESSYKKVQTAKVVDDQVLRTYKLALAGTGEYSTYHIIEQGLENASDAKKKAGVMAAMTTAITQVNALFENDLAISLMLVDNNDELIYLDPDTDPYSNFTDTLSILYNQNQINIDNVIKPDNYDIGHVFTTGFGGAVAFPGIVCRAGLKAKATTGSENPGGDIFYFDMVAHEFGHQFGANHTFNGDADLCGEDNQRIEETAVEPGSGSTIMAYAGLCAPQNVQLNSDPYFHIISIQEIRAYVTNGAGNPCAIPTELVLNKFIPEVDAGDDMTIPIGTPFKLNGTGSDADGDQLSFTWEQTDNELTAVPPISNAKRGALYRSVLPNPKPERYMPSLNTLKNGVISSRWEVTPEVSREINFALTARDNHIEAGQVASDAMLVKVTDAAGPFKVSSQNIEGLAWTANTKEIISWDVAGTTGNGVNVPTVNILLSTDGGNTFPTVLEANVANDGSQIITVPDVQVAQCFVMIEAIGNIFFSMNMAPFSIGEYNEICKVYTAEDTPLAIPDGDVNGVSSNILISEDVSVESIKVRLINEQGSSLISPGITHSFLKDLSVSLESPQGTVVELVNRICDESDDIEAVFSDDGEGLSCNFSSPGISGTLKPAQELSAFNGEDAQGKWILKVIDHETVDTGFLESWGLEICSSKSVLDVNNYVFDDFKLFPNPTEGIFTVKFRSENLGDVDITVYDILGRMVSDHTYKSQQNSFEEQMDLSQVSKGMYILRVKRGNKISSQKIHIN
ncbi:zinc-dependent metalloprotease family protein [Lutimonas halocynthiae]|uniref:T9SS type A sorting domain-containing protein n=1 Tax=Lutimonas halocynthiae TaxID=1446477 RepID=UPI0025B5B1FE|nr:zinc-dependent metalloprotease family protein [Lutimonas halocynthiae]MDN3642982.1 zinc-dependent metalloprotease family protein [Lutimonas halocynthiae]